MKKIRSKPDVFQYVDLLKFLADLVSYFRTRRSPLSVREISKRAGFKSSSYLSMLIKGQRKFSPSSLNALLDVFELSDIEKEFAIALHDLPHAKDPESRALLFERLKQIQNKKSIRKIAISQIDRLSHWCMPVIYEALNTEWRKKSVDEMAKDLGVESQVVAGILEELQKMSLIESSSSGWNRLDVHFQTHVETFSKAVRGLHSQILMKGIEALALPTIERSVYGQTIALSKEGFQKVKEVIAEDFKKLGTELTDTERPEGIYQLSFVIFPILKF